jgi:HAD superfamily hydrolase (TIGR01509 family)
VSECDAQPVELPALSDWNAVLFDLDGVLIDSYDAWVEVLAQCRRGRGLPLLSGEEFQAGWGQGIAADCERWFPGESPAVLALEYDRLFRDQLRQVRRVEGIGPLLEVVGARGWRRAVVTNSPRGVAELVLAATDLLSCFDTLATGDEVLHGKPDPALVRLALRRLDAEPHEVVMLGDTQRDVEAARAAGVFVVGLNTPGDASIRQLSQFTARLK